MKRFDLSSPYRIWRLRILLLAGLGNREITSYIMNCGDDANGWSLTTLERVFTNQPKDYQLHAYRSEFFCTARGSGSEIGPVLLNFGLSWYDPQLFAMPDRASNTRLFLARHNDGV